MPNTPARPELPEPDGFKEIRIGDEWAEVPFYREETAQEALEDLEAWARADERRKALKEAVEAVQRLIDKEQTI